MLGYFAIELSLAICFLKYALALSVWYEITFSRYSLSRLLLEFVIPHSWINNIGTCSFPTILSIDSSLSNAAFIDFKSVLFSTKSSKSLTLVIMAFSFLTCRYRWHSG